MAKKDPAGDSAAKVQAGPENKPVTRTALARQLTAANQDLTSVYESEHRWRLDLLKAHEEITRDTVDIEVEIRRLQQEGIQLKTKLGELEKQRDKLAAEDQNLSRQAAQLEQERDELQGKCEGLNETVKELGRESDALSKDAAKLKADVERLESLRKDYLSQIAKFRSQKAKLVEE